MADADENDDGKKRSPRGRVGARAAALRRAREAKQARDVERLARERAVESALADYYIAAGAVDRTRERAMQKAEEIIRQAETAAQDSLAEAEDALRRLRELGETRSWIKEVTGVSGSHLYGALASGTDQDGNPGAGQGGGDIGGPQTQAQAPAGPDGDPDSAALDPRLSRRQRSTSTVASVDEGAGDPASEHVQGTDGSGDSGRSDGTSDESAPPDAGPGWT
jgi:hypothetical protein